MNTLNIAFYPELLREMILGNKRKTVASLTTFGLIVYLLFLLSIYASSLMIPISSIDVVPYLDTSEREEFHKRFAISEDEASGGKWIEYFLLFPDPRIQRIKRIAGTTNAQGVGQFLINEGNKKLGRSLLNARDDRQKNKGMEDAVNAFFYPLIMVVSWLIFSLFVNSPQISFKQTFYMVCYVMLFWELFFNAHTFIQLFNNESALSQWFDNSIAIGLNILYIVHIVWFFNRSHDYSYLKVFGALIASVVTFVALLLGIFLLVVASSILWSAVWSSLSIHW